MTLLSNRLLLVGLASVLGTFELRAEDFDRSIAPLLASRCLECHSGSEPQGELDLSSRTSALRGGENGPVLKPGSLSDSRLWEYVRDDEMPPKKPLPKAEKELLRRWIEGGAKWGGDPIDRFRYTTSTRAGYDWWSLRPVTRPRRPEVKDGNWPLRELDYFILARLEAAGLEPSEPAPRRALIRRLSFDLLGLPPSPEQVEEFVADTDAQAYERLVDRLLSSKHYGERWARHWLDVARFGESDGFEYDRPRDNAWPYRDWVIQALNQDVPYDEFARRQLAGDVLEPNDGGAIQATGFLVCGAFDGLKPSGDTMRAIMRQDELDDLVGVVSQTFLGLTVNCARCHDHKFDPIRQTDYYRIASALSGVHRGDRAVRQGGDADALNAEIARFSRELQTIDAAARAAILADKRRQREDDPAPAPMARWSFDSGLRDEIGSLHGQSHGGAKVFEGKLRLDGRSAYVSTQPLPTDLRAKTLSVWILLDGLDQQGGGALSVQTTDGNVFDAIVFAEKEPRRWMAGSDGFRRTQSFQGSPEEEGRETVHLAIVYRENGVIEAYRNGLPHGRSYASSGIVTFPAGKTQVLFGLRHGTGPGGNRMLAASIDRAELFDRALTAREVAAAAGVPLISESEIVARLAPAQQERRRELHRQIADRRTDLSRISVSKVYAVTPRPAPVVHVLDRGSPFEARQAVSAGGVASVVGLSPDFGLSRDAPEAERRKKLAAWITSPQNPLFARTMVNRLWHYHFGAGLVETPNDLGFSGGLPSCPEALDYLATRLVEEGFHVKQLHREIVTSAAYRQGSRFRSAAAQRDAGNRLLWRKTPMRLEAEAVRDAVLLVAGKLNPAMGGRGFEDFNKYSDRNTWRYDPVDRIGDEYNRRSIYRTWARGGRNPLLDTFDCPDPSTTTPRRGVTTTPLQALALLNNPFMLRMSRHFAERVVGDAGEQVEDQVQRAYALAFGRPATDSEVKTAAEFVREYGLPALCRVIFNANEFLYIE